MLHKGGLCSIAIAINSMFMLGHRIEELQFVSFRFSQHGASYCLKSTFSRNIPVSCALLGRCVTKTSLREAHSNADET